MGAGLLVTAAADTAAAGPWGAYGIAAGNAAGITVTAALLLRGLAGHPLALRAAALAPALARTLAAALAATAAGWAVASRLTGPASGAAAGALTVTAVFAGVAAAAGVPEARPRYLLALVTRKARP
jgi:putative peptidoglycan lipid II flippase